MVGIPARQPDLKEEKKGPRVGAPDNAVAGFLKSAGLASLAEATIQKDAKKGDFYVALIEKPGRPAIDVLAEILPLVIRTFPWPKSMRWGERSAKPGALTWVRPLHSIVATFGPETEDPDIVPFVIDGIEASDMTRGHRFMAPKSFKVKHFDDYAAKLAKAKVVLDPARRREIILADAKNLAFAQGFELIEDQGLLDEVAGLVEWPVVLMGSFDDDVPGDAARGDPHHHPRQPEVLRGAQGRAKGRRPRQQVHPCRQHRSHRRRQGHHRRQRARHPRPAVGCEVFLRERSEDAAGRAVAEIRAHRVPREARHPVGSHRAHRARSPPSWRRWSAPMSRRRSARRDSPRPIF